MSNAVGVVPIRCGGAQEKEFRAERPAAGVGAVDQALLEERAEESVRGWPSKTGRPCGGGGRRAAGLVHGDRVEHRCYPADDIFACVHWVNATWVDGSRYE
jgi:hypothetical protein